MTYYVKNAVSRETISTDRQNYVSLTFIFNTARLQLRAVIIPCLLIQFSVLFVVYSFEPS